jgi:hypothetical protein
MSEVVRGSQLPMRGRSDYLIVLWSHKLLAELLHALLVDLRHVVIEQPNSDDLPKLEAIHIICSCRRLDGNRRISTS